MFTVAEFVLLLRPFLEKEARLTRSDPSKHHPPQAPELVAKGKFVSIGSLDVANKQPDVTFAIGYQTFAFGTNQVVRLREEQGRIVVTFKSLVSEELWTLEVVKQDP